MVFEIDCRISYTQKPSYLGCHWTKTRLIWLGFHNGTLESLQASPFFLFSFFFFFSSSSSSFSSSTIFSNPNLVLQQSDKVRLTGQLDWHWTPLLAMSLFHDVCDGKRQKGLFCNFLKVE